MFYSSFIIGVIVVGILRINNLKMLEIQRLNDFDGANTFRLDRDCAEKLRYEHPEQYNTLLKMHLSFELDLHLIDE